MIIKFVEINAEDVQGPELMLWDDEIIYIDDVDLEEDNVMLVNFCNNYDFDYGQKVMVVDPELWKTGESQAVLSIITEAMGSADLMEFIQKVDEKNEE